jgi:hypothetical protein
MKKTILTLAMVAITAASFAQGRLTIANDSTRLFQLNGTSINGTENLMLALYAGTSSGSMALQTSFALTGANYLSPGRMANKPFTLVGVPGGSQQFFNIIIVDTGADLLNSIDGAQFARNADSTSSNPTASAALGATLYGSSGLFQFTPSTSAISAPFIYAPPSTWVAGSVHITAVPEPSSMALAGLGAASLLIFRRRK